ncbi:CRAL-TRIO domain-containing protein [Phlyctochytrium arcticum]|nr:CRAL-TRIO domain-containing protein [Phlyctochytrium arcticum]
MSKPTLVPPHQSYPSTFPPLLTPSETEAVKDLRGKLPGLIPSDFSQEERQHATRFADDDCMRRYLVAHKWLAEKAAKGLSETIIWRKEYRVDYITAEEIESEAKHGTNYVSGFDRIGRPIVYLKKKDKTENHDLNVRMLVHVLETAIKAMPKGVEKVAIIMDFTHYTRANSPPLHISRLTLHIFSAHYPERLGISMMFNSPWVFSTFWTLFSPFIDPVTKDKIKFFKWAKGQEKESPLLEIIESSQLEMTYGGQSDFQFDCDLYWDCVRQTLS